MGNLNKITIYFFFFQKTNFFNFKILGKLDIDDEIFCKNTNLEF